MDNYYGAVMMPFLELDKLMIIVRVHLYGK